MTIPPVDNLPTTKIGVIGAGASGLTQIQQLIEIWNRQDVRDKSILEVVAFEGNEDVGGVWLTDDKSKSNSRTHLPAQNESEKGVEETFSYPPKGENPSPMYHGLRTNLPNDLMSFRGFPFPENTPLFPTQELVQKYLQSYADHYSLREHIRFSNRVERVYLTSQEEDSPSKATEGGEGGTKSGEKKKWTIESHDLKSGHRRKEEFDHVVVSNGHYSDGWIPPIKGLSSFPGEIIHSRFFHKASDYKGKTVLVVGSFASGGDISRLLASENINKFSPNGEPLNGAKKEEFIKIYVSSSGPSTHSIIDGPWFPFVHHYPLISYLTPPSPDPPKGIIHFEPNDGEGQSKLDNIDIIIFATGYNFNFPFFKSSDKPWNTTKISERVVRKGERLGGEEWEENGLKGQGIDGLDDLLLFLRGDRSISFPTLSYQNVPFPLAQVQTRFTSYLWAGLLPSLPNSIKLPPNPSNPYSQSQTESTGQDKEDKGQIDPPQPESSDKSTKPRKVLQRIKHLVFGAPYEWTYSEFLMDYMTNSDKERGRETEDYWRRIEGWRRGRREDTGLRKKTLGY